MISKIRKAGDVLASVIVAGAIMIVFSSPWFFLMALIVYFAIQEHREEY